MKNQVHECRFSDELSARVVVDPNRLKRRKAFVMQVTWNPEPPDMRQGDLFYLYRDWMNGVIDQYVQKTGTSAMWVYEGREAWGFFPKKKPYKMLPK